MKKIKMDLISVAMNRYMMFPKLEDYDCEAEGGLLIGMFPNTSKLA